MWRGSCGQKGKKIYTFSHHMKGKDSGTFFTFNMNHYDETPEPTEYRTVSQLSGTGAKVIVLEMCRKDT